MNRICIYCGSNPGNKEAYGRMTDLLAAELIKHGIGLVYGGASVGIMGRIADAVLARGGQAIGVIPQMLVDKEVAHAGLSELRVVYSMHERKATMADLADGFIALPGGLGTLEELFEILTWSQLGLHGKPCGLLNMEGYYDHLARFLDHAVAEGFVKPEHRRLLIVDGRPDRLLERMYAFRPAAREKWLRREET